VNIELHCTSFVGFFAEQDLFEIRQCLRDVIGLKALSEATNVFSNKKLIVVDNEHTIDRCLY
jgi:hypothetical protein